jgi:spermidine/putrescine transport system substrate-binding protein
MKRHALAALAAGVVLAAACAQQPAATEPPATPMPAATSEHCGDPTQLSDELFFYTWVEYIDPAIKDQFESECGVKIVEDNFDSNETLLAKIQAGGANYDVIASDYMVDIMIRRGSWSRWISR